MQCGSERPRRQASQQLGTKNMTCTFTVSRLRCKSIHLCPLRHVPLASLRVSGNGLRESGKHVAGNQALFFLGHRAAMFGIGARHTWRPCRQTNRQ
jgi:hypothetical protein